MHFQICPPGPHISLGLFVKFYEMLLDEVEDLDLKIVDKKAETNENDGETDFGKYVALLQQSRKHRQEAEQYRQQAHEMQEYITHRLATGNESPMDDDNPDKQVIEILLQSQQAFQDKAEEKVRK